MYKESAWRWKYELNRFKSVIRHILLPGIGKSCSTTVLRTAVEVAGDLGHWGYKGLLQSQLGPYCHKADDVSQAAEQPRETKSTGLS